MAGNTDLEAGTPGAGPGVRRKRRGRRWLLGTILVVVVIGVLSVLLVKPADGAPPLALPPGPGSVPAGAGSVDGAWTVGAGSLAGFRFRQTSLGKNSDVVGRTSAVTGNAVVAANRLSQATFTVDLTTIKVKGKIPPQFTKSLDTATDPQAKLTLTRPITLGSEVNKGAVLTLTATGNLTLHAVTRPVTFTISARRNGSNLETVGSIPITYSDWNIKPPKSYGAIGSIANHGSAEFLLVLHR